jgi:cytochrome c oxidase subunit I+III
MIQVEGATEHANPALRVALLAYCAVHAMVAGLVTTHSAWRWHAGYISAVRATEMRLAVLWSDYALFALLPAGAVLFMLANAGGAA